MSSPKHVLLTLKNIGPKMAERMLEAGIDSPEKLRQLGAKRAFDVMYETGDSYGDFNAAYSYALEGAIRDCDWTDIPSELRADYQAHAKRLQESRKPC